MLSKKGRYVSGLFYERLRCLAQHTGDEPENEKDRRHNQARHDEPAPAQRCAEADAGQGNPSGEFEGVDSLHDATVHDAASACTERIKLKHFS